MKILSIETAGEVCAVAVLQDGNLIKEEIIEDKNTHSVKLMPLLNKVLKETDIKVEDIDLFACDIGPGSFTGIRIGVSTIKAFLDVTNKKAVGITSLETLAYNLETEEIVCSLIDAKNENVYYGFFKKENGMYVQLEDLGFDNINNIIEIAKQKNKKIIFVGNGSIEYRDVIESKIEKAEVVLEKEKNKLNARNIGIAAFFKRKDSVNTNNLNPVYLRPSSAERLKKEK